MAEAFRPADSEIDKHQKPATSLFHLFTTVETLPLP